MRALQLLQVLFLLLIIGYGILTNLENPAPLHLPIPFSEREVLLPAGWALLFAALLGTLYGGLLMWPPLHNLRAQLRQNVQRRKRAERSLQATLRARLASTPNSEGQP